MVFGFFGCDVFVNYPSREWITEAFESNKAAPMPTGQGKRQGLERNFYEFLRFGAGQRSILEEVFGKPCGIPKTIGRLSLKSVWQIEKCRDGTKVTFSLLIRGPGLDQSNLNHLLPMGYRFKEFEPLFDFAGG